MAGAVALTYDNEKMQNWQRTKAWGNAGSKAATGFLAPTPGRRTPNTPHLSCWQLWQLTPSIVCHSTQCQGFFLGLPLLDTSSRKAGVQHRAHCTVEARGAVSLVRDGAPPLHVPMLAKAPGCRQACQTGSAQHACGCWVMGSAFVPRGLAAKPCSIQSHSTSK